MKKIILLSLLIISVVCGKSAEEIGSEWQQRYNEKVQKQIEIFWQNEEAKRLDSHCQSGNGDKGACKRIIDLQDKSCQNGLAGACVSLVGNYLRGNEQMGVKADENKAKYYADRVCALDATLCFGMSRMFSLKLALKYVEKACEMGEPIGCGVAASTYHSGAEGIAKNPQKVKYYSDKLCKAGHKEACQ